MFIDYSGHGLCFLVVVRCLHEIHVERAGCLNGNFVLLSVRRVGLRWSCFELIAAGEAPMINDMGRRSIHVALTIPWEGEC